MPIKGKSQSRDRKTLKPGLNAPEKFQKADLSSDFFPNKTEIDSLRQVLRLQIEKAELTEKLHQVIFRISELSSGVEDIKSFYAELHQVISTLLYAENFYIALIDSEQQRLDLVYFVDALDKAIDQQTCYSIPLSQKSLSSYVLQKKQVTLLQSDDIEKLENDGQVVRSGPKSTSWLGAPLIIDDKLIGIIVVQSYRDDQVYQQWHKELFDYSSNLVASTIVRKRHNLELESKVKEKTRALWEENEWRKRQLQIESALLDILELSNSSIKLDYFYARLHQIISRVIYAENFYIVLYEPEHDAIRFAYYEDKQDSRNLEDLGQIPLESIEKSLTAKLFHSGQTLLLDYDDLTEMVARGEVDPNGSYSQSWLGVPLKIDGKVIGVMTLQSYAESMCYNREDKKLVEYIAKTIATAIERKTSQLKLEKLVQARTEQLDATNLQLKQEIAEKNQVEKVQNVLYEIANLGSGAEDMSHFYQRIHRLLADLIYGDSFLIALFNPNNQKLEFKYFVHQQHNQPLQQNALPVDDAELIERLLHSSEPLLINKNAATPEILDQTFNLQNAKYVSWLGVPLRLDGESIGVVVIKSYDPTHSYGVWHKNLMAYVSHQLSITVQRKANKENLENLVKERTEKLKAEVVSRRKSEETQSALYLIANLANQDISLQDFYQALHVIVGKLVYCENFYIALKDEKNSAINFVYYVDTMDDYDLDSIAAIPMASMKNTLTMHVMKSGKTFLMDNRQILDLIESEKLDWFGNTQTLSWLGIPLMIEGNAIGIMALQSYRKDVIFTEQDKELMVFVGQHIATALQRHKNKEYLRYQVRHRTEELRLSNIKLQAQIIETEQAKKMQTALYRIADLASSAEDMDTFYLSLHQIIDQLIYAKNIFIGLYDDDKEKVDFVYFVDTQDSLSKDSIKQIPAAELEKTLSGVVLRTGKSFLKTPYNLEEQNKLDIKLIGKKSVYWLGVPLKSENNTLGIIVVQSYDRNIVFEEWHRELLEYVSQHIVVTLERKRAKQALEKHVEQRTSELAFANQALKLEIYERKRSEAVQSALYQVANIANQDMPLAAFYSRLHQIISTIIYARNFYIALWERDTDNMHWVFVVDSEGQYNVDSLADLPIDYRRKSFAHYIVGRNEAILVDGLTAEKMMAEGKVHLIGSPAEFFLGVPLVGSSGPIGAMAVQSYEKNIGYGESDIEFLNFVAQSIVSSIERREYNRQLEKRVEQRTKELTLANDQLQIEVAYRKESEKLQTALFEISETPLHCATENEMYSRLHDIIAELMYVEGFFIARVDEDNQCFYFDYVADNTDDSFPQSFPIGDSLTSYVYNQKKIVHINRAEIMALEKTGMIKAYGVYANDWVGVPLIIGNKTYGILTLQVYEKDHVYSEKEVNILSFVSTHIAEAIERKHTEKQLTKAYEALAEKTQKAEAASEAKSAFLATVSHEIRTPMNGILGMLSLLSDTSMSSRQRDYIAKISTSAESLLGIINDILDFSKIEEGKLELDCVEFDLLDLLDNLVDLFSARINEKNLQFTLDLHPNVGLIRFGDSLRLSQILINLIGNAIKFTDRGYIRITISETKKDILRFQVEDTGIGIAPENRKKIFSSFTQADGSTTRRFGGSGLGLSICQKLVELMHGEIEVSGDEGKGSCFDFQVNIGQSNQQNPTVENCHNASILLVSENPLQIQSWQHFFELIGLSFQIISGEQLLNQKQRGEKLAETLTLIFVDDDIEKHHGLDLLDTIEDLLLVNTPRILLTHSSNQVTELSVLDDKVQQIVKPVKMGVVLSLLRDDYDILRLGESKQGNAGKVNYRLAGKDILLAEDNLINQQVAKEMLQRAGVNVTLVGNGKEAVEACQKQSFDLVLMDMQMPVMDGYQAAQEIRQFLSMKKLPIIAMTANVMKGDKEKCLASGMNDYIGKPFDRTQFFSTIEQYLKTTKKTSSKPIIGTADESEDRGSDPLFDLKQLEEKFDSPELARQLVEIFCQTHQNDLDEILALLNSDQLQAAQEKVHKLKGSAGELGMSKLYLQAEAMDRKLKAQQKPSENRIGLFSESLNQTLQAVKQIHTFR